MEPLTEDDFGEADSVWMIIKKPLSQFKEIREQILKNQEIAGKWNKVISGSNGLITTPEEIYKWKEDAVKYKLMMTPNAKDMEKALQIVERMKKLDLKKKIDEAYFNCNRDHPETREILANLSNDIQKILGEKNGN